jgi:BspA type Leucine rich repeat region (6 copies)
MKKPILFMLSIMTSILLNATINKTVNCTAGSLTTLLSATEKSNVTNLTVTGTIDSRDFKTMQLMPLLRSVDLSASAISAYQNNLVNQIPKYAFCDTVNWTVSKLQNIVMPNSTKSIGRYAFSNCRNLTSLTIPNGVETINEFAFYSCTGLVGSIVIPNSVVSLGNGSFKGCENLTGVTWPNSISVLPSEIFAGCMRLTSFQIPSNVTKIGDSSFYGCTGLTSITIPNSVTQIETLAFSGCSSLTTITISSSVTSIGWSAFANCTNLSSIKSKILVPLIFPLSSYVFDNVPKSTCTLYVPVGTKDAYKQAILWKDFTNIVEDVIPTSLDEANVKYRCYTVNSSLTLEGLNLGEQIRVTSISGAVVYSGLSNSDIMTVSLPQRGVYIVTVGNKSQSIVY